MQKITKYGFDGIFYEGQETRKALICISGSDGGMRYANQIAKCFYQEGITTLAVAYWRTPSTPKTLSEVPIEQIESAVLWLKNRGYQMVGIYGFSKGAELALTAASLIPQIGLVVAVSPGCCIFEGIAKPSYSGHSSWTWRGKELPYISFENTEVHMLRDFIRNHEFGFRKQYVEVLKKEKTEENTIKVEQIKGPILLLSAREDAQWPSRLMGELVCDRLQKKGFAYPFRHEVFSPASHILCPVESWMAKLYRVERKYNKECSEARKEAFKMAVQWMKEA